MWFQSGPCEALLSSRILWESWKINRDQLFVAEWYQKQKQRRFMRFPGFHSGGESGFPFISVQHQQSFLQESENGLQSLSWRDPGGWARQRERVCWFFSWWVQIGFVLCEKWRVYLCWHVLCCIHSAPVSSESQKIRGIFWPVTCIVFFLQVSLVTRAQSQGKSRDFPCMSEHDIRQFEHQMLFATQAQTQRNLIVAANPVCKIGHTSITHWPNNPSCAPFEFTLQLTFSA